jgi:hypothetical protein
MTRFFEGARRGWPASCVASALAAGMVWLFLARPAPVAAQVGTAQPLAPRAEHGPRFGALMVEIGRRFELLGRAAEAGNLALARYEVEELDEVFADLPRAELPDDVGGTNLAGLADAFARTNLPELKAALASGRPREVAAAFAQAAAVCNGCHRQSERPFIRVASEPGRAIPYLGAEGR